MRKIGLSLVLVLALLLTACGGGTGTTSEVPDTPSNPAGAEGAQETGPSGDASSEDAAVEAGDLFTDRDLSSDWDASQAVEISLEGDRISCDSPAVTVSGSVVQISAEGTYVCSGTWNGTILVDADKSDKVQLVLNGVDLSCDTSAVLYVRQADKVFLTTAAGTVNTLSNGGSFTAAEEANIDAVVFSKEDLTLNGAGTLVIDSPAGHGVVSKDDLKVTGGTVDITAASHGLSGKDSVRIAGGTLTIDAGKDAIHAEHDEDEEAGWVYIAGGTFALTATGDGISASSTLTIDGGTFAVTTGEGSANSSNAQAGQFSMGPYGRGGSSYPDASTDDISCKGLKAGTQILLNGGSFVIDSADDALHSNGDLTISGGTLEISAGDDGIHADQALSVSGGSISISQCYEGLEGLTVDISGGTITLNASDDGINAAGGRDSSGFGGWGNDSFQRSSGACITISGGTVDLTAAGDGIDSNGDLYVTGGTVYVSGPTSSADSALDYENSGVITGGTVIAAGSAGMAMNFGTSSTQGSMLLSLTGDAGSEITLKDSTGKTLLDWTAGKAFTCVVLSCPDLQVGETYTVSAGGTSASVTLSSTVVSQVGGMGGSMGGSGGMGGTGGTGGHRGH